MVNLLNEANDSRFATRKQNIVKDQSNPNCRVGNEIIHSTEILKSNLYGFSDACILVRGNLTVLAAQITQAIFKNPAPFTERIATIDRTTIDDAKHLDLGMLMYDQQNTIQLFLLDKQFMVLFKDEATNFDDAIGNIDGFKFL